MKITDNRWWEQNKCIWIEEKGFEINIEKDEVEIEYNWDNGYAGRGTGRMVISRQSLIEILNKMDEV